MCGIVGLLDPRAARPAPESERLVANMATALEARGPDGHGVWSDEAAGITLGHRRLSILDLSEHGAQPMRSADGRYVLTYNGEIYNHRELIADLAAAGVHLRGHSDTEALVEAISRWGLDATLERIDGMFAFGLWDRHERRLTLARDRMGEKPLYYGHVHGEFVFASTLHAIRRHPRFDLPIDRDALGLYFRHKYVPAPWSIFEGIFKLEPATTLTVDADGTHGDAQPYWSYLDVVDRGVTFDGSPTDAVDELDRLLEESVRQRLVADVPVGAFLSGGIDSSAVVAAAQRVSSTPVRTFTIGSPSTDFDESSDARRVAEHLGTDHTELIVTDSDALALVDRLGSVWDEPFGDSSQIPTLLVSQLARRHVTVALSGDGGDELFLGYNRYVWAPAIWARLHRVPVGARRVVAHTAGRVPSGWWDRAAGVVPASRRPRMVGLKVTKVLGVADAADQSEVFHRLVSHWQQPDRLVTGSREPSTLHTNPGRWPNRSYAEQMATVDAVTYLPDDILTKVDRASMSVSLEGRIPLLSRQIVEFAAGLPAGMKLRDGRSKWPLRQVLARSVPAELFERPKTGFGVPLADWLRGPLRDWADTVLCSPVLAEHLDPAVVLAAWRQHLAGRNGNAYCVWDVLMFCEWLTAATDPLPAVLR